MGHVDPDGSQRRHLYAMIFLGLVRGDVAIELIGISPRAQHPGDDDIGKVLGIGLRHVAQEFRAASLDIRQRIVRQAEQGGPVRTRTIIQPAKDRTETVARGDIEIAAIHVANHLHRLRIVDQHEHREMRQVEPMLVHDFGLLSALRQVGDVTLEWMHCSICGHCALTSG